MFQKEYVEGDFRITPKNPKHQVAIIKMEFQTTSAPPMTLEEQIASARLHLPMPAEEFLTDKGLGAKLYKEVGLKRFEKQEAALRAQPARLFISTQVRFVSIDGNSIAPVFTSAPGIFGATVSNKGFSQILALNPNFEGASVSRYFRMFPGHLSALVLPNRKVELTFIYLVPAETRNGKVQFYQNEPLEVPFNKP